MYLLVGILAITLLHDTDGAVTPACEPTQYLELHKIGILNCSFGVGFHGVFWYNSTDLVNDRPILNFKENDISGVGYLSGEYDIYPNGSLIINQVKFKHEKQFTVVFFKTQSEIPTNHLVRVITIVKPSVDFPVIDKCGSKSRFCLLEDPGSARIVCSVEGAKPSVLLHWTHITSQGEINITSLKTSVPKEGGTYDSNSSIEVHDFDSNILMLFSCKYICPSEILQSDRSSIILLSKKWQEIVTDPIKLWVKQDNRMEIVCSNKTISYVVWKKYSKNQVVDLVVSTFIGEKAITELSTDFRLEGNGVLTTEAVQVEHEGTYACIYHDGFTDNVNQYQLFVYVIPEPFYIDIKGCEPGLYCAIEVGVTGNLTCSLFGVRPEVDLTWKTSHGTQSSMIHFFEEKKQVSTDGVTFEITFTSSYKHKVPTKELLVLECAVAGSHAHLFKASRKVQAIFIDDSQTNEDGTMPNDAVSESKVKDLNHLTVAMLALFAFVVIVVISIVIIFTKVRTRRKIRRRRSSNREEVEMEDVLTPETTENVIPDKTKTFLDELRISYESMYNSIRPLPFMRDDAYGVEQLYVEGGLELKTSSITERGEWMTLKNYNELFNNPRIKSRLLVVEGDPGHGKSTLALKLAYDWCTMKQDSPLKDIDILLFFRLRDWPNKTSIFEAIRALLLPMDSTFTKEDIMNIIFHTKSILLILDGYDEFPCRDVDTDIRHVLQRSLFQKFQVILTTRTNCLPANITPNKDLLRMTGFNEIARVSYLHRVVEGISGVEPVEEVLERLQLDSILGDLCQVPLFFVMYVHLALRDKANINVDSVTDFFRYVIACFHRHQASKFSQNNASQLIVPDFDHAALDEIAFKSLMKTDSQKHWTKEELCTDLSDEFYNHYVQVGILVEQEASQFLSQKTILDYDAIHAKTIRVTFFHKLFCEWYAAHYLSRFASNASKTDLTNTLKTIDPFELQYVYRFTCGLNKEIATDIIHYLKCTPDGDNFAILCVMEQTGNIESIAKNITEVCSDNFLVSKDNSRLVQRSTLQLIAIASKMKIPIAWFHLEDCVANVQLDRPRIHLKSGLAVDTLKHVKELKITEMGRELTCEEALSVIKFSLNCDGLQMLTLNYCLLPKRFEEESFLQKFGKANTSVFWLPTTIWYRLRPSGQWETRYGGKKVSENDYRKEVKNFREEWRDTIR